MKITVLVQAEIYGWNHGFCEQGENDPAGNGNFSKMTMVNSSANMETDPKNAGVQWKLVCHKEKQHSTD